MEQRPGPINHNASLRFFARFFVLFAAFLLAGCNTDGGNPPPVPAGAASGKVIVPPDHTLEAEPNDSAAQAQAVTSDLSVGGAASETDPGFTAFSPDEFKIEDLYRLNAAEPVRIILSIAANEPKQLEEIDLDLFLMDSNGAILDASEGFGATELVETKAAGDFLIGIRAFAGASAYLLDLSPVGGLSAAGMEILPAAADWVAGEVIIKRKGSSAERRKPELFAARHGLAHQTSYPGGAELMRLAPVASFARKGKPSAGGKLSLPTGEGNVLKARLWETIRRLRSDPEVVYAEPNLFRRPSAIPSDPHYDLQWHYSLINLPEAWDVTTGSDSVIVAVIDSGARFDHPDLGPRLIAGYDFISDPLNAADNDSLDADATDVGDDPERRSSSFHGTHVAGTIGAASDNTAGVAGITWQTKIMPLRVCGTMGCADADIAQAIRYAASLENISGTLPAVRADVINLSLGGPGVSQTQQDAILAARNAGVIMVAAAGNENSGGPTSPAGLEGVISVGAVGINSKRAPYSNYGPDLDVAAPGGNAGEDLNGDGYPDGVLSTWGDDDHRVGFRFMQGTSMSAPHVAGVMALMRAVNPGITPPDIDQLLAGLHPATQIRITRDLGTPGRDDLYGHGLIDASQAVIAAKTVGGSPGGVPAGPILAVSTRALDFSNFIDTLQIDLSNAGTGTLNITNVTSDVPWLTVTPSSGAAPLTVTAAVNRTGLADGAHSGTVLITSDAAQNPTVAVLVKVRVGGPTSGNVGTVIVLVVEKETLDPVAEVEATAEGGYAFSMPDVPVGTYLIVAGTDRDGDFAICDMEDACGIYPDPVTITDGQETPNINFVIAEQVAPQSLASKDGRLKGMTWKRPTGRAD